MHFGQAIEILKEGGMVTRQGWNGKNMYLKLQPTDESNKMTLPYIYIKTVDDHYVPWMASQTDILTEDWQQIV
jgi:hypothetical protein